MSISLPLDLESPAAKECLSNCIFNPSAAFVSFVEFMNFEYDDEYIRPVYHCFLKDTDQEFYFSVAISKYFLTLLDKDPLFVVEDIAYSSTILEKIYTPQWKVLESY